MLIDIHSHIIPGIDDGPSDIALFLEMANHAVDAGITNVFATPHHRNGIFTNPKEKILQMVSQYQKYLLNEGIPLLIHPGQELRVRHDMFKHFELEVLTLGNRGKYLLLELPSKEVPIYIHDVMYELKLKGIVPIIVHPERNREIAEVPNLLFDMIGEGALVQLTAGSILGTFGKRIKSLSAQLLDHKMVHFIASDAHDSSTRNFSLREAYESISKDYGMEYTAIYKKNAESLLNGQNLEVEDPIPIRKKIFGWF